MAPHEERRWLGGPEAIEYTVRVSERARRVRLVMRPERLEVVIPRGLSERRIPKLLDEKREWIERAALAVEARRRRIADDPPCLPTTIALPAVAEEWLVEYRSPIGARADRSKEGESASGVRVREAAGHQLVVHGDMSDFEGCKDALCRWLSRRARAELPQRLEALARDHGFEYENISIRQQRTRWGSCSRHRTISLNARLLLLPATACDYVLLHELCHTSYMDHSERFWALLESCDPDYRTHKKLVRTASKSFPTWLDHQPEEGAM